MSDSISGEDVQNWRRFVEAYRSYSEASRSILSPGVDRPGLIRDALGRGGMDKFAALHVLPALKPDELKPLFDVLLDWCATGHSVSPNFRDAIKTLPRDWVLDRIERAAEPLLAAGGDEEYRRLLELYWELDRSLTGRLARRAAEHKDPDISEAGRDFLELLDESSDPDPLTPPPDGPAGQQPWPKRPARRLLG